MQVGDLVRWAGEDSEDDDVGVVIGFFGTDTTFPMAEVYWFCEQDEYRYEQNHPNVEVISESR